MSETKRGEALRRAAADRNSHGVGEYTLPSGEVIELAFFPEQLAYWHRAHDERRPPQAVEE